MRELGDLIAAWRQLPAGSEVVLATVVATSGSTYRRPGARMLLAKDNWLAGSISGGCLEGDVVQTAWDRTASGPALVTYDATADEDIVWGFGLGCNGLVQVLMERIPEDGGVLTFLAECHESRTPCVVATIVSEGPELGRRQIFGEADVASGSLMGSTAQSLLGKRKAEIREVKGESVLFEAILPAPALVIFGAGHDSAPLVVAAKAVGWHVTVVDWRPNYVTAARFPAADQLIIARPEGTGDLSLEPGCAVVAMTHNYLNDLEILRHTLPSPASYVGLLGPRRRADRLLSDLKPDPRHLGKLRAPIGLDLGAEGPDEIALAVVAEIQAFFASRPGGTLNGNSAPLHQPTGAIITTAPREPVACAIEGA